MLVLLLGELVRFYRFEYFPSSSPLTTHSHWLDPLLPG